MVGRNSSILSDEDRTLTLNRAAVGDVSSVVARSAADRDLPRLNEKQLAQRWNISVRTLQAARVKGGGVPFMRVGRAVRYRMEDVLAYEQDRLHTSTSELK